MPTICSFNGILIKMYFGDHLPPHFHVEYGEHTAVISIKDFRIITGYLPPKVLARIVQWASIYQEELTRNWNDLSEKGPGTFKKMKPLK